MSIRDLSFAVCLGVALIAAPESAAAQEGDSNRDVSRLRLQLQDVLRQDPSAVTPERAASRAGLNAVFSKSVAQTPASTPPVIIEYSDAYRTRARIHRIASYATVPLFATELFLGESLYDHPSEGKKSAHLVVAGSIAGLFAVNTVTGVWNLMEARHDPNGRRRRWVHGLLMLVADAGFVATGALAPDDDGEEGGREGAGSGSNSSRSTHRAVAISSIAIASVGYIVQVLGKK
jgi:hypothetical protein